MRIPRVGADTRLVLACRVAAAFVFGMPVALAGQAHDFRSYSALEGLPQTQVLALRQDAHGYIWIGSYGGLTRYDGSEFRTYTKADGLSSNSITELTHDDRGRLLIGTIGGGVCIREDAAFRCFSVTPGRPGAEVRHLLPEPGGAVWIATERGVSRLVGDAVQAFDTNDGLPAAPVNRLTRDASGRLWAGTEAGLVRLEGQRFVRDHHAELGTAIVRLLLNTPEGLLVGTANGLYLRTDATVTRIGGDVIPPSVIFTDAAVDDKGVTWIATRSGVLRKDGSRFDWLTRKNGLTTEQINRVIIDREQNVWFGTEFGIDQLVPGPFALLSEPDGLPDRFVQAVAEGPDGRLWIGTRNGLAVQQDSNRFRTVDLGGQLLDPRVYTLAPLPDGSVLIGTRRGLFHYDGRVRRRYLAADGLPGEFVVRLLPDPKGGIWIATDRGVARWESGRIVPVDVPELAAAFVIAMAYDTHGRLWFGRRAGGAVVYDDGATRTLGPAEGVTDQTVWSVASDGVGGMWIGTNGDGAFHVSDGGIRRFTTKEGLVNDFVWQVLTTSSGDVWLFTSHGLSRYADGVFRTYGRGDGLLDLEGTAHAALEDSRGSLWFGTGTGVARYVPSLDRPSFTAPPVYVEDVVAGQRVISATDPRVPPGSGVLKIRFSSPSFRDPASTRFRYRLLGTDSEWSEPTLERAIGYAGLGPGRYEFEVVAVNDEGIESTMPATFAFTVLPAFWQTWWFRLLALLALGLAVAAVPIFRAHRLDQERVRLESVVAEHTRELAQQNARLEREAAERIHAETELRRSEERLRDIVEHSTNMFYSHTAEHVLTYVSPQSRQFVGIEPEEALRRWTEMVTDNPINEIGFRSTTRAIETGEKQPPYELELRAVDGRKVWVLVNEAPIVRDGRTVAIIGSLTDITEQKRARLKEAELELQLRQAQKMEAIGRLAGGIAHDFNNMLTSVIGNTEMISAELGPSHMLQAEVGEIRGAADRATSLVSQLLAFSRQQLVMTRVLDLNVVVTEASRMLQRLIGTDIELTLLLEGELDHIRADRGQLDQILVNLVVNARDAMPAGGRIEIETANTTLTEPPLYDASGDFSVGPFVMLRVTDTGMGMSSETLSRAFEPFFTTKALGKGTGLGLATVYGIVKQNGGYIDVESEKDVGTTFRVFLPRVDAPASNDEPATPPPAAHSDHENRLVLVVEDEPAVRGLVCRTLRKYGYRVIEAADGVEGLDICRRHRGPIDLLLTDMIMPGLNGKQLADQAIAVRPSLPVLFMSGHTQDALGQRGMVQRATELIQKPFTPAELARRVQDVISRSTPARIASA